MRRVSAVRPDIHERFIAVVARAEAKLQSEQKARARRHEEQLARENREMMATRASRVGAPPLGGDEEGDEPSPTK
jgi:hypothetical protein